MEAMAFLPFLLRQDGIQITIKTMEDVFVGELRDDGKIHWDDGDVWQRNVSSSTVAEGPVADNPAAAEEWTSKPVAQDVATVYF